MAVWAALASGALGVGLVHAQQPPDEAATPTFPTEAELVVVDVVVLDGEGVPVAGLARDRFQVLEDGAPQPIVSFEAVEVAAPTATERAAVSAAPVRVSSNLGAEALAGRTFVVLFDDLNMTAEEAYRAKPAVVDFLERGVGEQDRVLLVASSGSAWWSARMPSGRGELVGLLKRLEGRLDPDTGPDYVSPWEALRIHVHRDQDVAFRVSKRLEAYNAIPADPRINDRRFVFDNPYLNSRAQQIYLGLIARLRQSLRVTERALEALSAQRGRKSLVFVSGGFVYDSTLPDMKRVTEAALRSNVAIYFVNARGLEGMPVEMTAEFGKAPYERDFGGRTYFGETLLQGELESEGTAVLAAESGGFTVKNRNDLADAIQRIARESEAYYLLGYRPPPSARDGRFHGIEVKLADGKGLKLRARKGYYALPPEEAPAGVPEQPEFQPALDAPFALGAVPLRMSAFVFDEKLLGRASVLIATEVDVSGFAFREEQGRLSDDLQFLLVVAHRESGDFVRYDQAVEMRFSRATLETLEQTGYLIARPFDLEPGRYQAKIAVRDKNSGAVGTVMHDFEVPDLGAFRVSTPLLTDSLQQPAEGGRPRPVLRVRRSYAPGATLFCEYEVYRAEPGEAGARRVLAGWEIRDAKGRLVAQAEPTPIAASADGRLQRLIGAPLEGAAPGDYELVLRLRDEVAERSLELREAFRVEGPVGRSSARSR